MPVRIRRRTFGDFVRAFFAFVALVLLVVGVPGALAYFVGWPLPHEVPSLDLLTQDVTSDVFVNVLAVVVWFAWAQFAACVLVEAKAAASGVGMPGRVPGAGASQALARQLVAAVLLLTATAASFAPGLSQLGQQLEQNQRQPAATAQQTPGGAHEARPAVDITTPDGDQSGPQVKEPGQKEQGQRDTKFYRIQPPEGRHHDSLWEIAERHLDDGRRYKEIYQLNKERIQPDGSKLSQASLIRPGWIMEMPADAHGGELVQLPDEKVEVPERIVEQLQKYDESSPNHDEHATSGEGQRLAPPGDEKTGPAVDRGGSKGIDAQQVPNADRADRSEAEAETEAEASESGDNAIGLPEALIGAPLLAAGLLALLGKRRRQALLQTVFGRRGTSPEPNGSAALARDALLVGADRGGVRFLDRALRGLSKSLSEASRPLPVIYAAWFTERQLFLQLAGAAGEPPAPWRTDQDDTFWCIDRADAEAYDIGEGDDAPAAPYPGLVSLGTREDARLLLNLESVPGIGSLKGTEEDRVAVLSAIAAELGTSGWSDRMTVTLVGFGERLVSLAPDRMRHLDGIPALVETMETETRARTGALGAAGHDSVLTGRAGRAGDSQWAPHLVLLADEPSSEDAEKLAQLASGATRLGIGYLIGTGQGDLRGASWEFEISADGTLSAPLLGLELKAQQIPAAQHDALVQLFAGVDASAEGEGAEATPDPGFLVDLSESGRPAVFARLMGTYEISGLPEPDAERGPIMCEALAVLLLHREGVHPQVLAAALWPRGVTEDVRDALIERLETWLGSDPSGSKRLRRDQEGRLRLAESVVCDFDVLRTLHHQALESGRANSPAVKERLLADALALVEGPMLPTRTQGRYGWLSNEIVEAQLPLLTADIGMALSELRREGGRPADAAAAVQAALVTAPADERLWLELLRAVHATGDEERLRATAAELLDRSAALHGARGLPSRTEALLDELLPTWRAGARAVAN